MLQRQPVTNSLSPPPWVGSCVELTLHWRVTQLAEYYATSHVSNLCQCILFLRCVYRPLNTNSDGFVGNLFVNVVFLK